jgi:hypothetical protein
MTDRGPNELVLDLAEDQAKKGIWGLKEALKTREAMEEALEALREALEASGGLKLKEAQKALKVARALEPWKALEAEEKAEPRKEAKANNELAKALKAVDKAKSGEEAEAYNELAKAYPKASAKASANANNELARAYAEYSTEKYVTLEGYLGARFEVNGTKWQMVYGDPECSTWVIIRDDAIVRYRSGEEKKPPFGELDVLWLKADASVLRGRESLDANEIHARTLRGEFIQAGEVDASMTGGTFSGATGFFCPTPPGGCGRRSLASPK